MNFRKVIYENVEKKPIHFTANIYIYGLQTFWSFMKFYFVHIVKVCFVFQNSHYAYIPPYMHKTFPTLEMRKNNNKSNFYEKASIELIFSRATKSLKMIYFTRPTGRVLKT